MRQQVFENALKRVVEIAQDRHNVRQVQSMRELLARVEIVATKALDRSSDPEGMHKK